MASEPTDTLLAAVDAALERLEARYHPDPLLEAYYARYHAAQHPTKDELEAQWAAQAREKARRLSTVTRRRDRWKKRAQELDALAMADPTSVEKAEDARFAKIRADEEHREWQEHLASQGGQNQA